MCRICFSRIEYNDAYHKNAAGTASVEIGPGGTKGEGEYGEKKDELLEQSNSMRGGCYGFCGRCRWNEGVCEWI